MPEEFIVGTVDDDQWIPGLLLTFEPRWWPTDPTLPKGLRTRPGTWGRVRPPDVGVIMTAIEEIHLASIRADLPPPDYRENVEWAMGIEARSSTLSVDRIRMGSPLQVLLELPPPVYVSTFSAFAFSLSYVLGVPYRAAASFERARKSYYEARHESAVANDEWLEYKKERIARQTQLRLRAVDIETPDRRREDPLPLSPPESSEAD
jgi:hypothetical protein